MSSLACAFTSASTLSHTGSPAEAVSIFVPSDATPTLAGPIQGTCAPANIDTTTGTYSPASTGPHSQMGGRTLHFGVRDSFN
jgi:hypothetical protein